jgi:hypothetical protein
MHRRALLASIGTIGATSLAGCVESEVFTDPSTTLRRLAVSNWDETSGHIYSLRVELDETVVHESTHEIEPAEEGIIPDQTVECTWEALPGRYVVSARVDGAEWHPFDVLENIETTPDCLTASVEHQPTSDGTDSLWLRVRDNCSQYAGELDVCNTVTSTSQKE